MTRTCQSLVLCLCFVATTALAEPARRPHVVGPRSNPVAQLPPAPQGTQRYVFAVLGSARHEVPARQAKQLHALGEQIARQGDVTLTGACNGKPEAVRQGALAAGGKTIGISPYSSFATHSRSGAPYEGFSVLQLTALPLAQRGQQRPNFIGREIDEIERSDGAIIVGGRTGTLTEFCIAYEEKRPIGILVGMGGISNVLKGVIQAVSRDGKKPAAPIIFDDDPQRLVQRLRRAIDKTKRLGIRGPLGDT